MRPWRRRATLDFSDYLELRHLHDHGALADDLRAMMPALERALRVDFARAIPNMATFADAPDAPPRDLTREAIRVAFAMREEFTRHGLTRSTLTGFDLPEGEGLKDWLDLVETERKLAMDARAQLRTFDAKIWRTYTGQRKVPTVARESLYAEPTR